MITDQSLPEAVIALQRRELAPETRQVVDEAARLLSEGREMEARALVEKAEALVAQGTKGNGTAGNGNGAVKGNGNSGLAPQGIIAPLAAKLAAGFTGVLTNVLEDVHRYTGDQIQAVATALQEHIQNMEAALRQVAGVGERLEQLANEHGARIQVVQQGQEELWSAIRALQQADQEQSASMARVAAATEGLSHHVASQADAVASRFQSLEERVSVLDRIIAHDLQPQLTGVIARLDRHTDTLRCLEQRQAQRVSTLNQVLDSLSRLKEDAPVEMALPAIA